MLPRGSDTPPVGRITDVAMGSRLFLGVAALSLPIGADATRSLRRTSRRRAVVAGVDTHGDPLTLLPAARRGDAYGMGDGLGEADGGGSAL
jgi:hypothetical protein